jgi:hypothetical protein
VVLGLHDAVGDVIDERLLRDFSWLMKVRIFTSFETSFSPRGQLLRIRSSTSASVIFPVLAASSSVCFTSARRRKRSSLIRPK